jgi:hypothetical protein
MITATEKYRRRDKLQDELWSQQRNIGRNAGEIKRWF